MSEIINYKFETYMCKECLVQKNQKKCPNISISSPCILIFGDAPCTNLCNHGIVARCPIEAIRKGKRVQYLKPKWVKLHE